MFLKYIELIECTMHQLDGVLVVDDVNCDAWGSVQYGCQGEEASDPRVNTPHTHTHAHTSLEITFDVLRECSASLSNKNCNSLAYASSKLIGFGDMIDIV